MNTGSSLSGIIPPLVTPLTENLELDQDALVKLVDYVIDGGVDGVFLLGSIGEGASLSNPIRQEIIRNSISSVNNRIPVLVNITTPSFIESVSLAEFAAQEGADYLVLAPPFYYEMDQMELTRYIEKISDESPLPIFLYNAPQFTKNFIDIETVNELSKRENIVGIKDSSDSKVFVAKLIDNLGASDFSILVGPEIYLGEFVQMGCNGGVCGGANIFPQLYVRLFNAAVQNDISEIRKYQDLIEKVYRIVYQTTSSPMAVVIGLKDVLSSKGINSGQMAMPVYRKLASVKKKMLENLISEFEELGI